MEHNTPALYMQLLLWQFFLASPGPLSDDTEARRRVRRIAEVGMRLLRHDGEFESAFVVDDATL